MQDRCEHNNIQQIEYRRDSAANGVHGPYFEIWLVQCRTCGKKFEESIEKD